MKKAAAWSTAVVVAHLIVSFVHGMAHGKLHIELSRAQLLFVVAVISAAPVLSVVLLWTKQRRIGGWLLVTSMGAALLFGAYYHFLLPGPDNILQTRSEDWVLPFQVTAALLALLEAAGIAVGVWALRAMRRAA
jgi:hypothetical protein